MKKHLLLLLITILFSTFCRADNYTQSNLMQIWNKSGTNEYKAGVFCTFTSINPVSYKKISNQLISQIGVNISGDKYTWSIGSVQYIPQMNQLNVMVEIRFEQSNENTMGLPIDDTGKLNDKYYTPSEMQKIVTWKAKELTGNVIASLQSMLKEDDGDWVPFASFGNKSFVAKHK
jgi:hypothetical protein